MKLKDFAEKAFYLPATAVSGLANLVLGYTEKPKVKGSEEDLLDEYQPRPKQKPGLLTLALVGVNYVAVAVADFIAAHKKAIAAAFWASLALAGAAALTLFLWPAALTAVAGFTVYGLSIAGIAGANALAQIGLAAALTAAVTSAATVLGATVVNAFTAVRDYIKNRKLEVRKDGQQPENDPEFDQEDDLIHSGSPNKLSKLGFGTGLQDRTESAPEHTSTLLHEASSHSDLEEEVHHDDSLTSRMN